MASISLKTHEVERFELSIVPPTPSIEVKLIKKVSDQGEAAVEIWGVIFTICLLTAIAAMFLLLIEPDWKRKKTSLRQQSVSIPCQHCRFFNDSCYLKCAVHPAIVLTQQAIDCLDYQPCES